MSKLYPDKAKAFAVELMRDNDYPGEPVRSMDTEHDNAPCWVCSEIEGGAIVVYDDDPHCVVSTGNSPGRYPR